MKALVCHEIGDFETLAIGELPEPEAGPGEMVVEMDAAAVNFADLLVLQDLYQFRATPPFAPGMEGVGRVVAIGSGVDGWSVGERIAAVGYSGAFAERWVVQASHAVHVPDDAPTDVAAAMPVGYGTSYHALKQRAKLQPGETVLVLGAAGGVGAATIDLAAAMGAEVIAAASTQEKLDFCTDLGAHHTINYADDDLRDRIREITGGVGIDVVYDPVGGDMSEAAFRSLKWNGRHLVIGFASGTIPKLPLNLPLLKGASLVGVFWGAFAAHEPEANAENAEEMFSMLREGEILPRITERFSLDDAAEALNVVAERRVVGRVLVEIS